MNTCPLYGSRYEFSESNLKVCVMIAYLLMCSHPFATKLFKTVSPCVFVIVGLSELTSRSAANEDIQ